MGQPSRAMFDSDDTVAILLEGVVRSVILLVHAGFRLVVLAVRFPVASIPAVAVLALDRVAGRAFAVAALGVVVLLLVVWRFIWPVSFRRHVSPRALQAWLSLTYPRKWARIAPKVGLVVHDRNGGHTCGALKRVRVTPAGIVRLRVVIPTGLTLADFASRADALAVAFGVREARVTPAGTASVWVDLHRTDVLANTVAPLPTPDPERVSLAAVPVGQHEDGTAWEFCLWQTHVLIAGATGAGKGSILWSLLHGLAPAIGEGWVQVWAIDPKGGMELRPGRALFSRFEDSTPEAMCDLLEDLVAVMDHRAKALASQGVRKHRPSMDAPHVLAVIDELATLTAFAERDTVRRIDRALGLLLTKGRAVGITVLAAVQDPGKDVVGWRDLFPTRVAMRLDNPVQVDMVLGEGARDLGATADHISETTPGVAYVRIEGTRAIRRVRASYLTDDDITALAGSVIASPALSAPRPTRPEDMVDDRPIPMPKAEPQAPTTTDGADAKQTVRSRTPRKPRKARDRNGSKVA